MAIVNDEEDDEEEDEEYAREGIMIPYKTKKKDSIELNFFTQRWIYRRGC